MYPSRFRYEAPRSLDEAIGLLHEGGGEAKVLAGGQSLVPLMKLRFASPELLVDINNIPGLDYHRVDPDGTIHIGALCRHADLERSALLAAEQPTMAAAAPLIADPIVRNRGTLVGSLCHADPQGDWASVVTALGGHVVAAGPGGRRTHPDDRLRHRAVPERPRLSTRSRSRRSSRRRRASRPGGYLKLERRVGDFATAGVAVALETSGERHQGGHRADRRRRLDDRRRPRRRSRSSAGALTARSIAQAADLAAQAASRAPTTAAARSTSGTSCARSSCAS